MADRMMNFHSSILQVASIIKNKDQIKAKQKVEMEKKKRDRKANYSKQETDRLAELILLKKDVLECKKNTADQWNDKREAWEDIEREFNKQPGEDAVYRDSKNLRTKYESLKKDVKRKWHNIITNKKNSNGKIPKFSTAEKIIKDIISLPMEGLCDFDSIEDVNDDKSEDDESSDSSMSNYNHIADTSSVKQEEAISDEETSNFAYQNVNIEESRKGVHEDPLVGLQHHKKYSKYNDEPVNKIMRGNSLLDTNYDRRIVDVEEEKLKSRLQTDMLKEELEIKKLQRKMLEQELEHKKAIHELEKEHLLLKIKTLKNDHELM